MDKVYFMECVNMTSYLVLFVIEIPYRSLLINLDLELIWGLNVAKRSSFSLRYLIFSYDYS